MLIAPHRIPPNSITIPVEITAATILITFWDDNVCVFPARFPTKGTDFSRTYLISINTKLVIPLFFVFLSVSSMFLVSGISENVGLFFFFLSKQYFLISFQPNLSSPSSNVCFFPHFLLWCFDISAKSLLLLASFSVG